MLILKTRNTRKNRSFFAFKRFLYPLCEIGSTCLGRGDIGRKRFCACGVLVVASLSVPGCGGREKLGNNSNEGRVPESSELGVSESGMSKQAVASVSIRVTGFASTEGQCRIAGYRNQEGFNDPEKAYWKAAVEIAEDKSVRVDVPLVRGTSERSLMESSGSELWGVSAHHDRNRNDKLDKNTIGIPTEPYGFSRNPKRGFGPPRFQDVSFEIAVDASQQESIVEIEVR